MLALVHPLPQPSIFSSRSSSSSRKLHYHHHSAAIASSSTTQLNAAQSAPKTPTTSATTPATNPTACSSSTPAPTAPPVVGSPFDIHSYHSPDLLRLLASLLTQIAATNDALASPSLPSSPTSPSANHHHPPIWHTLTSASRASLSTPSSTLTFHARNIPAISLESYLLRILKYCPTTNEVFLSLLVYFDRMSKLAADATGRPFVIDSYNIHRLVIAGVTVASKFFSDVFYTNSRYAKVGGLPQAELNQLELQFLLLNDFKLVIPKDEMQRYAEQLVLFSQNNNTLDRQVASVPIIRSPQAPTIDVAHAVARPCATMGAIDAYGGSYAQSGPTTASSSTNAAPVGGASAPASTLTTDPVRTPNARPTSRHPRSVSEASNSTCSEEPYDSETDDARSIRSVSSAGVTDDGDEDEDEPTIRPVYSVDNRSLCSFESGEERAGEFVGIESGCETEEEAEAEGEMTPERRADDSVMGSP